MRAFAVLDYVYNDVNLALNQPASQISTYPSTVASRAVDGSLTTESCTLNAIHPWWSVDLGAAYDVGRVTVTNDANQNYGNTCFIPVGLIRMNLD